MYKTHAILIALVLAGSVLSFENTDLNGNHLEKTDADSKGTSLGEQIDIFNQDSINNEKNLIEIAQSSTETDAKNETTPKPDPTQSNADNEDKKSGTAEKDQRQDKNLAKNDEVKAEDTVAPEVVGNADETDARTEIPQESDAATKFAGDDDGTAESSQDSYVTAETSRETKTDEDESDVAAETSQETKDYAEGSDAATESPPQTEKKSDVAAEVPKKGKDNATTETPPENGKEIDVNVKETRGNEEDYDGTTEASQENRQGSDVAVDGPQKYEENGDLTTDEPQETTAVPVITTELLETVKTQNPLTSSTENAPQVPDEPVIEMVVDEIFSDISNYSRENQNVPLKAEKESEDLPQVPDKPEITVPDDGPSFARKQAEGEVHNGKSLVESDTGDNNSTKTGESKEEDLQTAGNKDTSILIILFCAVVAVGVAAFAYNFIKKRRQRNADLERVERGSSIKRSLQSLTKPDSNEQEMKPLILVEANKCAPLDSDDGDDVEKGNKVDKVQENGETNVKT